MCTPVPDRRNNRTGRVAWTFCHIQLNSQKSLSPFYPHHLRILGDHLRKRRLDLGLLQKEIAKEIGVNKSTITNWELNHNYPELRFIPAIIEFLGYWPLITQLTILASRSLLHALDKGLVRRSLPVVWGSTQVRWGDRSTAKDNH